MQAMAGTMWALGAANKAPAFAPSDLANLALWLKADALTLNDGDAVSTWTDSSGTGRDMAQSTVARKPTYKASIINGLPVLRFDGGDVLIGTSADWLNINRNVAGWTVFAVLKVTTPATAYQTILDTNNNALTSTDRASLYSNASKVEIGGRRLDANSYQAAQKATLGTGASIIGGRIDYANALISAGLNGSWSANVAFQTPGNTSDTAAGSLPCVGAQFGSDGTTMTLLYTGDIAEIIAYQAALSDANRTKVDTYLATKYGITLA